MAEAQQIAVGLGLVLLLVVIAVVGRKMSTASQRPKRSTEPDQAASAESDQAASAESDQVLSADGMPRTPSYLTPAAMTPTRGPMLPEMKLPPGLPTIGFYSDGGPAGHVLLGGSVVAHDMARKSILPCAKETFILNPEVHTWDERSNFTPNPNPENPNLVGLLGHDLMGVPRKFDLET